MLRSPILRHSVCKNEIGRVIRTYWALKILSYLYCRFRVVFMCSKYLTSTRRVDGVYSGYYSLNASLFHGPMVSTVCTGILT